MSQAVANHRGRKKRGWGRRERWEREKKGMGGIGESFKFGFNLWHDQDGG